MALTPHGTLRFATLATVSLASITLAACAPAVDPEPSASASAPEPSPSVTPVAIPEFPRVTGADAGVLERLWSPTTGETWHDPVPIENLGLLAYDNGIEDNYSYFEIGNRGSARIVAAVPEYFEYFFGGYAVYAMFEIEGDEARLITCPSARAGDACLDWSTDWEEPGRALDTLTHYDSLTYPEHAEVLEGWTLDLAHLAAADWVDAIQSFGDANAFPGITLAPEEAEFLGRGTPMEIAGLGASTLIEYRAPGDVPGLTDSRLAIETPYGGIVPSLSAFVSSYYGTGAVTWNDGVDTFTHPGIWDPTPQTFPVRPAGGTCFGPDETIAEDFDPSQWVVAGKHRLGFDVYVPADAGNELARAVWTTMRGASWGEDIEPELAYPYETLAAFLDARSLFAWERPDGEWVIAIDDFAGQRVYECA